MAEDSRPRPSDRPPELPRRVPGAGGLTPGQVRRGYLTARTPATAAQASPQADAPPGQAEQAQQAQQAQPPRPGGSLPRRSPGASAIQTPPGARRPVAPRRVDPPDPAAPAFAAVPPAAVPPETAPSAVTVKQSQPAVRATAVRPARRWQLAGLAMTVVAIIAAVVALIARAGAAEKRARRAGSGESAAR